MIVLTKSTQNHRTWFLKITYVTIIYINKAHTNFPPNLILQCACGNCGFLKHTNMHNFLERREISYFKTEWKSTGGKQYHVHLYFKASSLTELFCMCLEFVFTTFVCTFYSSINAVDFNKFINMLHLST